MRAFLVVLILSLLFQSAPPPPFTAVWQRPHVARLAWVQGAGVRETCLVRNTTLIGCWYDLAPGPTVLILGDAGPMDANYKPQAGDSFTVAQDGVTERARLAGMVYVASVRR